MPQLPRIDEGTFLQLGSSLGSRPATVHNATERPWILPIWDPQESIRSPPCGAQVRPSAFDFVGDNLPPRSPRVHRPIVSPQAEIYSIPEYYRQGDKTRTTRDFAPISVRPSRIRITPSSVYNGCEGHREPLHNPGERLMDRGLLAWAHVVAGILVVFNAQGLNMAYYQLSMPNEAPASIAWIGSLQIFFLFSMSLFVSPMMDKGYFRFCFNGGSALLVAAIFATSFCTTLTQLVFVQGILTGIAMGLIYASGVMVLITYFSKYLGIATGIGAAGGSLGGMIYPAISKSLIGSVGYAWTVKTIAFIALLTLLPANIIVRERPNRIAKRAITMDWTLFSDGPYLMMMAGMFFSFWGIYFGFYFIVSYGDTVLRLPSASSANLLIAMNAANLPGRFLPGLISDTCIGPVNTIVPSVFFAAMQVFAWIGITNEASLFIIACFYGFAAGGVQSLYNATIVSFGSSTPRGEISGMRLALVYVVIGVACLTGAPLGGALIQANGGDYLFAQVFAGTSITLGGLFLLGARLWKMGWKAQRL